MSKCHGERDRRVRRVHDPIDPVASFRLDGRTAIVTGASSGLGARMARVLDAAGATVVLAARREQRLEEVAARLTGRPVIVGCDVTDDGSVGAMIERAVDVTGRLDVVVNNAGVSSNVFAIDEDPDELRSTLAVNLVAPFVVAQRAARHMQANGGGVIVNVASMIALVGSGATPAAYAASKGGLVAMTRELAAQWARHGIRVNALCPGYFRSEMTSGAFDDPRFMAWLERKTPMRRPGADHELDGALLFLASDASSFVTGQAVVVDGGWTAI